jgi:hypothetical protein
VIIVYFWIWICHIAKTIGFSAIPNNIAGVRIFPADKPKTHQHLVKLLIEFLLYLLNILVVKADKSVLVDESTPSCQT